MVIIRKKGLLVSHKIIELGFYENYIIHKKKRVSFAKDVHTTNSTLDYFNTDFWGCSPVH